MSAADMPARRAAAILAVPVNMSLLDLCRLVDPQGRAVIRREVHNLVLTAPGGRRFLIYNAPKTLMN